MVDEPRRLTAVQLATELDLVESLRQRGLTFENRRVNLDKGPIFIEGWVEDVHVWIYENGGASVVGRGADHMIEKEDFDGPGELRAAVVDRVLELFE